MEILLELILEALLELVFEVGGAALDGSLNLSARTTRVSLKSVLYAGIGVAGAFLSTLLFPSPLVRLSAPVWIYLLLVPCAVGFIGMGFSRWSENRWHWDLAGSQFYYSFVLAFCFSLFRYLMLQH